MGYNKLGETGNQLLGSRIMKVWFLCRKGLFLAIGLHMFWQVSMSGGEPMEGLTSNLLLADNGHYVVVSFTGPRIVIWDMNRLWDYLQPTQIHVLSGNASFSTNAMAMTVSRNGKWLAYEDGEPRAIYVCAMGQGFECRSPITLGERFPSLELAPDGSQLIILTETRLLVVNLANKNEVRKREHHDWQCLKAEWAHGHIALGAADGTLTLLNLENLEPAQTVKGTPAQRCKVAFTSDAQHVVASWDTASEKQRVQVYPIEAQSSQPILPISIEDADYLVSGDSADALWYVSSYSNKQQRLTPLDPSGRKLTERSIVINTGSSKVLAVSESRGYILLDGYLLPFDEVYGGLYLLDLKSRLPLFRLYSSQVKYQDRGGYLPHLPPRLGTVLMYPELEKLFSHFDDAFSKKEQERVLLWMASVVTKRRARYDRVWFSLLTEFRDNEDQGQAYSRLSELTSALVQLNMAEHLLEFKNAEKALTVSREALKMLRAQKNQTVPLLQLDRSSPTLEALVLNYWDILEREFWLMLGSSFAALEHTQEAELAYREVLKHEPQEWRAYNGLLLLYLEADATTFDPLLEEAQTVLQLKGWTDRLPFGFPVQFFDGRVLESKRLVK